jgi:hypothetical protein
MLNGGINMQMWRFKMKKLGYVFCMLMLISLAAPIASAADITLNGGFDNQDGVITSLSVYPTTTLTYNVNTPGSHFLGVFFDYDIDASINGYLNEQGSPNPASGQSWEIDEPEYTFGNIYDNFSNSNLDNMAWDNTQSPDFKDDVAMAMGWNFTLLAGESAKITFDISDTAPMSGFYLDQYDSDSDAHIYLSSKFNKTSPPPSTVPEPGMLTLLFPGLGLAAAAFRFRKYV